MKSDKGEKLTIKNLLTLEKDHPPNIFKTIKSYIKDLNYDEANKIIDENLKESQNEIDISQLKYYKGVIQQGLKNYDKAVQYFSQSLELDPTNVRAAYSLALCENKRGNFAKALDDYQNALNADQAFTVRKTPILYSRNSIESIQKQSNSDENNEKSLDVFSKINQLIPSKNQKQHTSSVQYQKFFNIPTIKHNENQQQNQQLQQSSNNDNTPNNNKTRQKSKEVTERGIQHLTQMIMTKKQNATSTSQIQLKSTRSTKSLHLRDIANTKNQQFNRKSLKNLKQIKENIENMEQQHFHKGMLSSGELSSITGISSNNISNRASFTTRNLQLNTNRNFTNLTQSTNNMIHNSCKKFGNIKNENSGIKINRIASSKHNQKPVIVISIPFSG